jgi:HAD superfamily hydrolase (TIGR01549 family)
MATVKLILFDLDDTLVHFDDYWGQSLLEAFRRHEATRDVDVQALNDALWKYHAIYEAKYLNREVTLQEYWTLRLIRALAEFGRTIDMDVADHFNRFHQALSLTFIKPDPATVDLLAGLSRRYRLGIVTNGIRSWQMGKLEASGLLPFFDPELIIISEEAGCEKPDPEIYRRALSAARTDAEHALFVGDSWPNDVVGPGRLGIRAVWFSKRGMQAQPQSNLAGVISRLEELEAYLEPDRIGAEK